MKFLDIFNPTWDILTEESSGELNSLRSSLQSDPFPEVWVSGEFLHNAQDALAVLAVLPLSFESRNYFQIQEFRDHLGRMVQNYNFQGDWKIVGEILQTTDSTEVYSTWNIIFKKFNEHDWFGNFVPRLIRALKALRIRTKYQSVVDDTRPVRKPMRRRGYNDKGSKRSSHQWLPREYPELEKEKPRIDIKEPIPLFWFWRYQKGSG